MAQRSRHTNGVLNFYDDVFNPTFPVGLWKDCPILSIQADPNVGFIYFEDWTNNNMPDEAISAQGYVLSRSNSTGTFALGDADGGTIKLDSVASTRYDGIQIQANNTAFTPSATSDIWYETLFKIEDAAGSANAFIGLSSVDTSIMASGDLSPTNCIGFAMESSASGVVAFFARKAGHEKSDDSVVTLTEDTYLRLGFKINKLDTVDYYVNGVKTTSENITSAIPIVAMTRSLSIAGDVDSGTVADPILHEKYTKIVQAGR